MTARLKAARDEDKAVWRRRFAIFEVGWAVVAAAITLIAWRSWYWPSWLAMTGAATAGNLLGWWSMFWG